MQMINNYLNSLESYLPDEMKRDVREEFEASIYDQIEERQEQLNRDLTQNEQEMLLTNIGHPMQVAARYLPGQNLVGEAFFPAYKKALKIALLMTLTIKILLILPSILSTGSIFAHFFSVFWDFIDSMFLVFTAVTGVFYLMERYGLDLKYLYAFSAKDLHASNPKLALSRVETVFELLFLVLFIGWWNNAFTWQIAIDTDSFFNNISMSSQWQTVFWSVNVVVGLDILNSLYKIAYGSYNRISLIVGIVLNGATVFIIYQISRFSQFVVTTIVDKAELNWLKIEPMIKINIYIILAIILMVIVWDTVSSVKKLRYFK